MMFCVVSDCLVSCVMPTEAATTAGLSHNRALKLAYLTPSSHSFGSGPYYSGAYFTLQLIQQLNRKAAFNSETREKKACNLLSMYRLITRNTLLWHKPFLVVCVRPWACTVHEWLCHVSVSIPIWAMSSMSGVSVRTCWWSMRMLPQHFFAKDRYLWTMLCLCCKLALPTTRKTWTHFLFHVS